MEQNKYILDKYYQIGYRFPMVWAPEFTALGGKPESVIEQAIVDEGHKRLGVHL
jgi:hypothetical protein